MHKVILSKLIKEICNKENGMVVADMQRNGVNYYKNFGVSIMYLRQMANKLEPNWDLATALWDKNWRETKIIATLITPSKTEASLLLTWAEACDTSELIEQFTLNTCVRNDHVSNLITEWVKSDNDKVLAIAYGTLAHLSLRDKSIDNAFFEGFLPQLYHQAKTATPTNKRALALALRRIGRRSKSLHTACVSIANNLMIETNVNSQWIADDALTELNDEYIISLLTI